MTTFRCPTDIETLSLGTHFQLCKVRSFYVIDRTNWMNLFITESYLCKGSLPYLSPRLECFYDFHSLEVSCRRYCVTGAVGIIEWITLWVCLAVFYSRYSWLSELFIIWIFIHQVSSGSCRSSDRTDILVADKTQPELTRFSLESYGCRVSAGRVAFQTVNFSVMS